ncbi:uncharacterized protein LOC144108220 [Amblyomma americanum]
MPDMKNAGLLRLSGHIGGVNWRPTRFVDCVPSANVCGLCRTIPKGTVQLPCAHFLCESCLGGSRHNGVALCPLDLEPFEEKECQRIHFPARKGNSMKAYCWNEERGCQFMGTVDALLRHYETDCIFQAIECPRCGLGVLHKDLPAHYISGCVVNTSSPRTGQIPMQDASVPRIQQIKNALFSSTRHQQPVNQNQIKELVKESKKHGAQLESVSREIKEPERNPERQVALTGNHFYSTLSECLEPVGPLLQQNLAAPNEASVSEAGGNRTSLPWGMEKKLILRKLEVLADVSLRAKGQLRESIDPIPNGRSLWWQLQRIVDKQKVVATSAFSTLFCRSSVDRFTLRNVEQLLQTPEEVPIGILTEIPYFHSMETCITLAVSIVKRSDSLDQPRLQVDVRYRPLLGTFCLPCHADMSIQATSSGQSFLTSVPVESFPRPAGDEPFDRWLLDPLNLLRKDGCLHNGQIVLHLHLEGTSSAV